MYTIVTSAPTNDKTILIFFGVNCNFYIKHCVYQKYLFKFSK